MRAAREERDPPGDMGAEKISDKWAKKEPFNNGHAATVVGAYTQQKAAVEPD